MPMGTTRCSVAARRPLNSPDYQKNDKRGGRIGYETPADMRIANIKVFHDGVHASRRILPLAAGPPALRRQAP
jgi:hypothetical protein